MTSGLWLDALLVALVLAALAVLYRDEPAALLATRRSALREVASRPGGRILRRLGGYYRPLLRQAGYDPDAHRGDFWSAKILAAVLLPQLLLEVLETVGSGTAGSWLFLSALAGFLLPDLALLYLRRRRRQRVAQALPYFVDLLVAFLYSGLSVVEAFRRAGREGFSPRHPFAREAAVVGRELDAGQEPSDAFRDLANRTGVAELKAVASSLRIGMRLGAPVQETLASQAEALWIKRRENAVRRIHRVEIMVMIPAMLAGLPIFAVLTLFPLIMDFIDAMRQATGL